ncbi:hypothetical protein IOLA_203 [uncultured bacterium]|nr:hypothetical protein IOLA_203 [uncultured bacterium]
MDHQIKIQKCINILKQEIYNNDNQLLQFIELSDYLSDFLYGLNIDIVDIQCILQIIDILNNSNSKCINQKLSSKNLSVIIPSLNPRIRNIILNSRN